MGQQDKETGSNRPVSMAREVDSIDYTDTYDPDLRVERLVSILKNAKEKCILVGSSMGGYVSLMASREVRPTPYS